MPPQKKHVAELLESTAPIRALGPAPSTEPIAVTVAETRRLTGLGTTSIYALIKRGLLTTCRAADIDRTLITYASVKALFNQAPLESATSLPPPRRRRGRPAGRRSRRGDQGTR